MWSQTAQDEPTTLLDAEIEHSDHTALEPSTDDEPTATVEDELPTEKVRRRGRANNLPGAATEHCDHATLEPIPFDAET